MGQYCIRKWPVSTKGHVGRSPQKVKCWAVVYFPFKHFNNMSAKVLLLPPSQGLAHWSCLVCQETQVSAVVHQNCQGDHASLKEQSRILSSWLVRWKFLGNCLQNFVEDPIFNLVFQFWTSRWCHASHLFWCGAHNDSKRNKDCFSCQNLAGVHQCTFERLQQLQPVPISVFPWFIPWLPGQLHPTCKCSE